MKVHQNNGRKRKVRKAKKVAPNRQPKKRGRKKKVQPEEGLEKVKKQIRAVKKLSQK